MRIGIFTDTYLPIVSGVVTSIDVLTHELTEMGHEVYIFTNQSSPFKETKNLICFSGLTVPLKSLNSYKLTFALRNKIKEIKKYNLDIIHIETEFTIAKLGYLASKKLNIPMVYTLHTLYEEYLGYISKTIDKHFHKEFLASLATILLRKINQRAAIKIVPSRKVLSQVSNYMLDGEFAVIPTGLSLERFKNERISEDEIDSLKSSLGIKSDDLVCISIGRISKEKSLDKIIYGFSQALKDKNAKLLIVGDGPILDDLKKYSKSLGIENQVIFLGQIENSKIVPYYQMGNVFLNASTSETQGLTYIESLATGIPLLCQKDECLEDVLIDGFNGLYFDGVNSLIAKLNKIYDEKNLLEYYSSNASSSVNKFSKEAFAEQTLEVYKRAIAKFKIKKRRFIFN